MPKYVDIAFPTAVRQLFTYQVPDQLKKKIQIGIRVWVPLRNYYAIGVIVRIHDQIPDFETRDIKEILDKEPIIEGELLKLTKWINQFYYCSWGEVIQAALPAGLNFISRKFLKLSGKKEEFVALSEKENEVLKEVRNQKALTLDDAKKRWKGTSLNKSLTDLIKEGFLEIWEEPDLKVSVKKEREWDWAEGQSVEKAKEFLLSIEGTLNKWQLALKKLTEAGLPQRQSSLISVEEFIGYPKKKLQDSGWITYREVEAGSVEPDLEFDPNSIKLLNKAQKGAFGKISKSIQEEIFTNFLLYGITGSGKTEVYIHALREVRSKGKGGIVLVPEIALTPQTVSRFYKVFGAEVAVLHSRMTSRERLQVWKDLKNGTKNIAIGPRSAVFAPVQNLGLIVLDEEHDASYKQMDPAPRYHARETAIMRANLVKAVVIMGSATPSMQALNMAGKGKSTLLELKERHAEAVLPEVNIIDLKQYTGAMKGELSAPLFIAIEKALNQENQVILLYNRRGFASYMQCETCGNIPQSPECSVSLTYHKRKNMLMCHYSGYSRRADVNCEVCGSDKMIVQGMGTQKIEESLETLFPKARILRFDKDTTTKKGAHARILNSFGNGEADILIGTQLVAKGLDFPNVTVVGVIDADTEQAFPSFQSNERTYQLLSQVSGRSGRGSKPGEVFIQTRQPENSAIQFAKTHDHEGFSKEEMGFRKPLNYPPYSRLIKFTLKGKEEYQVSEAAHNLRRVVERVVPELEILGPSSSAIGWMNRNYFWELTLKIEPDKGAGYIEVLLEKVMEVYERNSSIGMATVRININVDAIR
ncbi:MAG: primosomal protein N' [Balneolaceae bacterium]